ncbi:MAG: cyanophycin synthetase, partial [Betaproteobacteria bacterium]|nr:cyanophycin synthetase [Betaproteobacteria bacterium]
MTFDDIQILQQRFLRGPNFWTYRSAVEAWLDIGELEKFPSNTIPGFVDRLIEWLPSLQQHHCSVGEVGGFVWRLRDGTWPAHIIEHVAIELQTLAGMQVSFGKARETSTSGVYKVVFRARQEEIGLESLVDARNLVMAAINNKPFDAKATVKKLKDMVDRLCLGPSTACIVDAATERRIPSIRLTSGNLVQLGYGSRQRRIWTAETDKTSAIAEHISSDKDLTKRLLTQCGVPVPQGRTVTTAEEAWSVAQDIGLPVVLKPIDANHGRGVSLDLKTQAEVHAAFDIALREEENNEVIVEQFIVGEEHRLLVVGNKVVAASRGETVQVVGDGVSTVEQLIDSQVNTDPRRGLEEEFPLEKIILSEQGNIVLEIQKQGFEVHSVPDKGTVIIVQRTGNMANDVTDDVHPQVADMAILAAKVVGLDIAGIDLVTPDVSRPLLEVHGAVVEVNAGPGLLMHLKPVVGKPRPVGQAIVDQLFESSDSGRIPIVGVMGSHQATELSKIIAWLFELSGKHTGLACADGLYLDQRRVVSKDARSFELGQRLLINRVLDAAVFESSGMQLMDEGLAYDRCLVGVVTGVPEPVGLEVHDIRTPEQMRNVMRNQVDVVLPEGVAVLNACDEVAVSFEELSDGDVFFYS